jgi:phosphatidylglycerophosphatase A
MDALARLLATAGGAGLAPIAPGTAGTAVAVGLVYLAAPLPSWAYWLVTAAVTLVAVWAAGRADAFWRTHDDGRIVIDEVAGYFATMAFVDRADWRLLAIGFAVFRVLDIVKPPPARWIDRNLEGGLGVVLDDVVAGAQGAALMVGIEWLIRHPPV